MLSSGWAGDYNEIGQWNTIAPFADARGMVEPVWLPDRYMAYAWRAYHTAKPNVKLTGPVIEYRKKDGKWGGPECGLGYGGQVKARTPLTFTAETTGDYAKIEFYDGDQLLGSAERGKALEGVKLERGLHVLYAVGVGSNGSRSASRPGFLVVE